MAPHAPTSAHPTHPGDGETYEHTDGAPMRRELLRSDPQPHAFPPRGEPLAKFGPTAAHPMYPGGGDINSPTGRDPDRWEASRIPTHPHDNPPRVEPLAKFGTADDHPTHPGGGKIYPSTGWRARTGSYMLSMHQTNPPERHHKRGGNPWRHFCHRLRSPGTPPHIPPGTGGERNLTYLGRPPPTRKI